jgi:acetyl-CoA synthetase
VQHIDTGRLTEAGATPARAESLARAWAASADSEPEDRWRSLSREALQPDDPPAVHQLLYAAAYAARPPEDGPGPAWFPDPAQAAGTNAAKLMREVGAESFEALHAWSVADRPRFWARMVEELAVRLDAPAGATVDLTGGSEAPRWLPGARMNIARTALAGPPDAPAIIAGREDGSLETMTVGALDALSGRVAAGLAALGLAPGDAVGICTPMHAPSVAIYLGIVRAGMAAVSVADSFSSEEIATRLDLGAAKAVITQDVIARGGRRHPLYPRVQEALGDARLAGASIRAVVLAGTDAPVAELRPEDLDWEAFLPQDPSTGFVPREPHDTTNVLFSSGTTGDPKAIPWTHTTPLRCAVDGRFHHDIRPGDVVAWPTNLGWMMGPWLIYASLMNGAAMALFDGAPTGRAFGAFVQDAHVTMLGVVPSLVRAWRASGCLDGTDWSRIRCFSSTGECSSPVDMLWLMARAGYRPVVEYCGGTEIGGGYITGSLLQPVAPSTFTTPALGLDLVLLSEAGKPADAGEVYLIGPSMGLSTRLGNRDHHEVYFAGAPRGPHGEVLRRHGDQLERLPGGLWRALGRVDDTMNLGGIKVSSAEIERVCARSPEVREAAAIAVPPEGGGPSVLVVFCVPADGASPEPEALRADLAARIKRELNPLFRLHDVVIADALPRTASNKVMRRVLRGSCR